MRVGDQLLYEGELCTIVDIYRQVTPSPSGDVLLKDSLGVPFLIHHSEIE